MELVEKELVSARSQLNENIYLAEFESYTKNRDEKNGTDSEMEAEQIREAFDGKVYGWEIYKTHPIVNDLMRDMEDEDETVRYELAKAISNAKLHTMSRMRRRMRSLSDSENGLASEPESSSDRDENGEFRPDSNSRSE
eukprot:CAMPEP_0182444996 /NCGR_PEP_ID=MMETSP1172-20130603/3273_1 /TAXON_ID=708627 /ORGANISM="Timspurckia oligopyrenoides, Strain CCMP3278" /LENGTH=138 /DNA_ID=CAMNT_0024640681 /DNA_START=594 /DNA_END=1010 /DNA_ORIENTATION=-